MTIRSSATLPFGELCNFLVRNRSARRGRREAEVLRWWLQRGLRCWNGVGRHHRASVWTVIDEAVRWVDASEFPWVAQSDAHRCPVVVLGNVYDGHIFANATGAAPVGMINFNHAWIDDARYDR